MTGRASPRPPSRRSWRRPVALAGAFLVSVGPPVNAQDVQASSQTEQAAAPESPPKWRCVLDDRPSLRLGDVFRIDLSARVDAAVRDSPDVDLKRGAFAFEHGRLGFQGRVFGIVAFEVERELRDDEQPWRDVFVELRNWRAARIRGGRFKIPFGRERMTSITDLDFVYRSLATEALTPGRDSGVELYGRPLDWLTYRAGVFNHDGDTSRAGTDAPADTTFVAGVTLTPLGRSSRRALRALEVGTAATVGDVPAGLNGLSARTIGGYEALPPLFVSGRRVRVAADARWSVGPIAVAGEVLLARDQRLQQGLLDDDLPDVLGRGWFASGTWVVLGALTSGASRPRRGLEQGGVGAIQLAGRIEFLGFSSPGAIDEPLRNPRAASVLGNDIRGETVGVNWYPIRFVKLQFNLIRERVEDPERRPDPVRASVFTRVFRVQFAM